MSHSAAFGGVSEFFRPPTLQDAFDFAGFLVDLFAVLLPGAFPSVLSVRGIQGVGVAGFALFMRGLRERTATPREGETGE